MTEEEHEQLVRMKGRVWRAICDGVRGHRQGAAGAYEALVAEGMDPDAARAAVNMAVDGRGR